MNTPVAASNRTRRPSSRRSTAIVHQRGAALLTAMIIVTLVSTLAAAMVWQQWRAVQVESAERDRTQAAWTLSSALQFASLVLRENKGSYTALTDFWATPLAEGRVSTLNGTDKSTDADDDSQGFLSGSIEDAHARYNLLNLVMPASSAASAPPLVAPNGGTKSNKYQQDDAQLPILESLCQSANRDSSVAARIATELVEAANAGAGAPLMPETVDQLVWFGIDQASIDALRPYVTLLPPNPTPNSNPTLGLGPRQKNSTQVNVNTASATVLIALSDTGVAQKIVQRRQTAPFKTLDELKTALSLSAEQWTQLSPNIAVHSYFFEVRGRLRLADRVLAQKSLVYRDANRKVTALRSERIASLEQVAP